MSREEYQALDLDAKMELIRGLVPVGLMHVQEVETLAGEWYARKHERTAGIRHGSNPEGEQLEICMGLLLGLYRIRGMQADEFLGWAPDFPEETAAHALWLVAGREGLKRTKRARHAGPRVDQQFVDKYIPDWNALVARALEARERPRDSARRTVEQRATRQIRRAGYVGCVR